MLDLEKKSYLSGPVEAGEAKAVVEGGATEEEVEEDDSL